eukprot:TRINITY_DN565_c0_g1_i1.p2 TRINITY_DN565_c0_g1~~TRINITY_DN565_c0_g1_i1.p2  ORF type:complete len:273 (-),score=75.14 TRINITY_DN565_c0_g1_i1:1886-2704(-)
MTEALPRASLAPPSLHIALRLLRRFSSVLYLLLALFFAALSLLVALLPLQLHASHQLRRVVPAAAALLAAVAVTVVLWRRHVVSRRLRAVADALQLEPQHHQQARDALRALLLSANAHAPLLPQLSKRLRAATDHSVSAAHHLSPHSSLTPLLSSSSCTTERDALRHLHEHPLTQAHALMTSALRTLSFAAALHPLPSGLLALLLWRARLKRESVALNVAGSLTGAVAQAFAWWMRRRVRRVGDSLAEQLLQQHLSRGAARAERATHSVLLL